MRVQHRLRVSGLRSFSLLTCIGARPTYSRIPHGTEPALSLNHTPRNFDISPRTIRPKSRLLSGTAGAKSKNYKKNAFVGIDWPLEQGYSVGGILPGGADLQEGSHGSPVWGASNVPLRFRTEHGAQSVSFPNFWLRDNCQCPVCVNQDTLQRAFDTFSIPTQVRPQEVVTAWEGLQVTWNHDGHVSLYPWEWLYRKATKLSSTIDARSNHWGADVKQSPPTVGYDEVMADDEGVGKWTAKIKTYGFCYVEGCPTDPKKTQELLERISFIRVTHYGGFYDFTSDLTMKDTAYTNLELSAHTDTTYFTDPAGLQMFHLLSHTSGSGGDSLLVDGFHAASILQQESPEHYTALASTPLTWHASGNEGITITPAIKYPVLNLVGGKLIQVRWNNDDRGPLCISEDGGVSANKWYAAARHWSEILKRREMAYWTPYVPGRPVIFDNWRVLHGRGKFTGKRRMCGGYINHDDYVSRWRNTNFTREEALGQIL